MAGSYMVEVHQSSRSSSPGSSYSNASGSYASSSASTPSRSLTPGVYRQYGSDDHVTRVSKSTNGQYVVSHNRPGYESASPTPGYGGSYGRS